MKISIRKKLLLSFAAVIVCNFILCGYIYMAAKGIIGKNNFDLVTSILAIIILASVVGAFVIISSLTKHMKMITEVLGKTADFDFSFDEKSYEQIKSLKSKDELKAMAVALVKMRTKLRKMLDVITNSSSNIANGALEMNRTIEEDVRAIESITAAADEIASSSGELSKGALNGTEKLERLADQISDINNSTNAMHEYINEAKKANTEGIDNINQLMSLIKNNEEVSDKVVNKIDDLKEKSELISNITSTINGIASQINLLALNASIESARAGEAGKGFAVVANEIKKLASDTEQSTKEIENIVNGFQTMILETQKEMVEASGVIHSTGEVSRSTVQAFHTIEDSVKNIVTHIGSLAKGIETVNINKDSVVENIEEMTAVAEEYASNTEEISASLQEQNANMEIILNTSESLSKISEELQQLTQEFKLN